MLVTRVRLPACAFWPIELLTHTSRPGFDSSGCAQSDTGATATTGIYTNVFFVKNTRTLQFCRLRRASYLVEMSQFFKDRVI